MQETTERTVHLSSAQVEAIKKGRMDLIVQLMAPQPPANAIGVGTSIFSEPDWEYRVNDPLFGIQVYRFACPYGVPGDVITVDQGEGKGVLRLKVVDIRLWRIAQVSYPEAIRCGLYDLGVVGARWHWDPKAPKGYESPTLALRAWWREMYTLPGTTWDENPWVWSISVKPCDD